MPGIKLNHRTKITILNTSAHKLFVGPASLKPGEVKTILLDSVPLSRLGRFQRAGHLEITQVVDEDGETIASTHTAAQPTPTPVESVAEPVSAPVEQPKVDASGPSEGDVDPLDEFAALAPKKAEDPVVVEPPAPSPEEVAKRRSELDDLKVAELRAILVERGQKTDDLRKPELIEAIIATDPKG